MLTVVWSFRNRFDDLAASVLTAHGTCQAECPFLLVDADSSLETLHRLRYMLTAIPRRIKIVESHHRMSLAEAWNLGIHLATTDRVVIASSDSHFLSNTWDRRLGYSDYTLLGNHAVFALSKSAVKRIGWFDEGFGLGPHFDCDYMIRASEAGIDPVIIPNDGYYRHPNAMEGRLLKELPDRLPMHDPANERYFKAKWQTDWPGWTGAADHEHPPHPPTHISQVKRLLPEIDPHPRWTERLP